MYGEELHHRIVGSPAAGSVTIRYGGNSSRHGYRDPGAPSRHRILSVDRRLRRAMYAAGKTPVFLCDARAGRPKAGDSLTCRLTIDRPIRPLPDGSRNDVQIVPNCTIARPGKTNPIFFAIIGASAALTVSWTSRSTGADYRRQASLAHTASSYQSDEVAGREPAGACQCFVRREIKWNGRGRSEPA